MSERSDTIQGWAHSRAVGSRSRSGRRPRATSARVRLTAFALVAGFALSTGAVAGRVVDPDDSHDLSVSEVAKVSSSGPEPDGTGDPHGSGHHTGDSDGGVFSSQAGYRISADNTFVDGSRGAPFRFRVVGPDGSTVRDFELRHEKELHLIVVARDLSAYAHLHPSMDPEGTWTAALPALAPGVHRAFASFAVSEGPELTLGVDLFVPGSVLFAPLAETANPVNVDGYQVALTEVPAEGATTMIALTVSKGGVPVADLEPYLGALGHLVVIRVGDLALRHAHPLDDRAEPAGPKVRFLVDLQPAAEYRMFFEFSHAGAVHTAAFTARRPPDAPTSSLVPPTGDDSRELPPTQEHG